MLLASPLRLLLLVFDFSDELGTLALTEFEFMSFLSFVVLYTDSNKTGLQNLADLASFSFFFRVEFCISSST